MRKVEFPEIQRRVTERSGLAHRGVLHAAEGAVRPPNILILGEVPMAGSWLGELVDEEDGLHLIDIRGHPATEARIYPNQVFVGNPDSRGLLTFELGPGNNIIEVNYSGSSTEFVVEVIGEPLARPFQRGSDEVLTFIALIFTPLLDPILAIADILRCYR